MVPIIEWFGFAGSWLLVAGPLQQAALELEEEMAAQRGLLQAASARAEHPPSVSPWWWFLPPVKYVLERRRSRAYHESVMAQMSSEELVGVMRYMHKARGWMLVGFGALCIAVKETWRLHEVYAWPLAAFFVLVVVMAVGVFATTVVGARHRHDTLDRGGPRAASRE